MRRILAVFLLTACAVAQTAEKPKLSVNYSKAALRALITISQEQSANPDSLDVARIKTELVNAEVEVVSDEEKSSLESLKNAAEYHMLMLSVSSVTLDAKCIAEWKDALRARDINLPTICKLSKKG